MNRSLFCIFINYLNVEVDQLFQVALNVQVSSTDPQPMYHHLYSTVWTLMTLLYSSCLLLNVILQIQRRIPISYLGSTIYKTTMRKKKTLKRPHSLSPLSVSGFLFLFFKWGYNPISIGRCRSYFSTKHKAGSSFGWLLASFSLISKGNSTIEVLHYWVMNTSKLVNSELQLSLCF